MTASLELVRTPDMVPLQRRTPPSGLELVSEVTDLVVGAGMLTFVLAPFALPGLALIALTLLVLVVPALGVALILAPFMFARRWWRSRARQPAATSPARYGDGDAAGETTLRDLALADARHLFDNGDARSDR